jgi:tRNA pseudouridine(55) synthase
MNLYPKWATVEKAVGETPLVAAERLRESLVIPQDIPFAYAGRLDPMASGKLLILIGDECKKQKEYHSFDKEYRVEILLGAHSDTGDVLGLIESRFLPPYAQMDILKVLSRLRGHIALPYPHYSSKTVRGKPLHTWTLEKRLHEIEIPTQHSVIHRVTLNGVRMVSRDEVLETVRTKIETIPKVTDERKALGADFRRDDVRASWDCFATTASTTLPLITVTIIASSGTYMRSLAEYVGTQLGTGGLAYSIHRTKIGSYFSLGAKAGFWVKRF